MAAIEQSHGGVGYGQDIPAPSKRGYRPPRRKGKRKKNGLASPTPRRPPDGQAFGNRQQVKGGVKQRALRRLNVLDGVQGVGRQGGITGREARKIRTAYRTRGRGGGGQRPGASYNPLEQLSGRSLDRELDARTRLRYGPQEREVGRQRLISDRTSQAIPGWYAEYERVIQENAARTRAANEAAQAAAYAQANQAAGTDVQAAEALTAKAAADAAARGTTPSGEAAAALLAGAAGRQALGSSFGGMLASQGQAAYGRQQDQSRIGAARKIQALAEERAKRFDIDKLAEELASEKGEFRLKERGELTQRERRYALEQAAFEVDLEQADTQEDVARIYARAKRDAARENRRGVEAQARAKRNARTDVHTYYHGGRPEGKTGSSIPSTHITAYRRALRKAIDLVERTSQGRKTAIEQLVSRYDIDPFLAAVAWAEVKQGGVLPGTARRLWQDYGLRRPTRSRGGGGGAGEPTPFSGPRTS